MENRHRMRERIHKRLPVEFVQEVLSSFNQHRISEKEAMDFWGSREAVFISSESDGC